MNILWVVNIEMPQLIRQKGLKPKGSGGWLELMAEQLSKEHSLTVLYPNHKEDEQVAENIVFHSFPRVPIQNLDISIDWFAIVFKKYKPDVIHIWGSENKHACAATEAAKRLGLEDHVILSIQGIISCIEKHYYGEVPYKVQNGATIRDLFKRDSLKHQKEQMKKDAFYERKAIKNVKHVIGRTNWDRVCTRLINPKVIYHYNAENMRQAFYGETWDRENCRERRIFVAQGYYPLKGLHVLLLALPYLKKLYPDICVHVGGYNNAFQTGIKKTAYGKYLQGIIERYELQDQVKYVGLLTEKEMLDEYKNAEVFVSPSAIENSSNSIAEAMLLGMPVVASNVGGTPDMLEDHEEGLLYQWDSPEMLAYSLKRLFDSKELELDLASRAKARAITRQDFQTNYRTLMSIYTKCLRDE